MRRPFARSARVLIAHFIGPAPEKAEFLFNLEWEARGFSLDRAVEAAGRGPNSNGRAIRTDEFRMTFFKPNPCETP